MTALDLPLGTTVTVPKAAVLVRTRSGMRAWQRTLAPVHARLGSHTGVIVGHRTLANGYMDGGGYEWESGIYEPDSWSTSEYVGAYLVAIGMRKALVRVYSQDVTVVSGGAPGLLGARVQVDANAELVKRSADAASMDWAAPYDPATPDERRWVAPGAQYVPRPVTGFIAGTRTVYDTDVVQPDPYSRERPQVARRGTHAVTLVSIHPRQRPLLMPTSAVGLS
jgi:hypothetical protein